MWLFSIADKSLKFPDFALLSCICHVTIIQLLKMWGAFVDCSGSTWHLLYRENECNQILERIFGVMYYIIAACFIESGIDLFLQRMFIHFCSDYSVKEGKHSLNDLNYLFSLCLSLLWFLHILYSNACVDNFCIILESQYFSLPFGNHINTVRNYYNTTICPTLVNNSQRK